MTVRLLVTTILAFGVAVMVSEAGAVVEPDSRVELVPEGSAWLVGHSGLNPHARPAAVPEKFEQEHGGLWNGRRSGPSGNFLRFWGEGIPFDKAVMTDDLVALEATEEFWRDHEYLLPRGVSADDLVPFNNSSWNGIRMVSHVQTVDGIRVLGTGTYAVFMAGRLVLFGVRAFPAAGVDTDPSVEKEQAVSAAIGFLASRGIPSVVEEASLAVFPMVAEDSTWYDLVWKVRLDGNARGRWTAYVDAREGGLVALRDERLFADGTVQIRHHDRHPGNPLVYGPAYYMDLHTTGGDATTDVAGGFSFTGTTADVSGGLTGPYVVVETQTGDDVVFDAGVAGGETYQWGVDGGEIEQAQMDGYEFASTVHEHAKAHQDDLVWLDQPVEVNPNVWDMDGDEEQDICNAWADGESINFLMGGTYSGGGCNNTAMLADVVYHEYGHCVHIQNVFYHGDGEFDEATSEAFADTMSVSITNDPHLGMYFFTSGGYLRDLEQDLSWPGDVSEDPHQTGIILGGAMWDLRVEFMDELGEAAGRALTDEIFFDMMRLTGDIPSAYEAALIADDDNGNLSDGTPNLCAIYDNFALHGLGANGVGLVTIEHLQLENIPDPAEEIAVEADVYVTNAECSTLGDVTLAYSVDDGDTWQELPMAAGAGDTFSAQIDPQPEGTVVRYRIEAVEEGSGEVLSRPANPAEPYYKTYVGPLQEIFCDDLETENDGWTHELIAGEDIEGADDWQWGTPNGKGGDPEGAYSGNKVWGNDLAPEDNWNGQYQADRINTLRSPVWDLSEYEIVRLRFRRWLGVEDGFYDQANVYVNEELVWTNYRSPGSGDDHTVHQEDREWILEDIDISEIAGGQEEVQVRWEIQSDQGLQFAGWTIDDVCMYTTGSADDPVDAGTDAGIDTDTAADAGEPFMGAKSGCGCDAAGSDGSGGYLLRLFGALL